MKHKKLLATLLLPLYVFAAPNAPSALNLLALSAHSVSLSWVDNSDDESGFKIWRNGALIHITSANVESFVDKNLLANTTYTYIVKATNNLENIIFQTGVPQSHVAHDDKDTQRGVPHHYTKEGTIMIDTVTSLKWQDTNIQNKNYDGAVAYCQNLSLGGESNWRLPSLKELTSLIQLDASPTINESFSARRGGRFWSATTYPFDNSKYAYYVNFSNGFTAQYGERAPFEKSNNYSVRCVAGEDARISNFSRDNQNNIVKDSGTNLMWEDTTHIQSTSSIESAINYCESLFLGGFTDWHLPNINEFYSITNRAYYDDAIDDAFENKVSIGTNNSGSAYRAANYWTSTYYGPRDDDPSIHYYRTFHERDGVSHRCRSYMGMHVRCVRAVK